MRTLYFLAARNLSASHPAAGNHNDIKIIEKYHEKFQKQCLTIHIAI